LKTPSRHSRPTKSYDQGRLIIGREAVTAVFTAKLRQPRSMTIAVGERPQLTHLIKLAQDAGIPVSEAPYAVLSKQAGSDSHQGVLLAADPLPMHSAEELARSLKKPLLLLDHLEDPQNLGACLRAAAELGAGGVIFPKVRAAPLSPAALKAAVGAAEFVPLAMEANMAEALRKCRSAGRWIIGSKMDAQTPSWQASWNRPLVIVIGGESSGLSRLVEELCDEVVSLPSENGLSLNASVAAAILLYEAYTNKL